MTKGQAASGAGRGVPQFPTDIVTLLLRHIEQNQRLSSCALVSSSWQQVTNAVSSHVSCKLGTAEGYSSLSAWLSSNCSTTQINSIEVDSTLPQYRTPPNEAHVLQLPLQSLSKLQALKLLLCQLQATRQVSAAAADRVEAEAEVVPASLAALTALTQLDLKSCTLDLSELGSCTNLRHLNLKDCLHTAAAVVHPETPSRLEAAPEAAEDTFGTMLAAALPQLQQLTHLTLQQWINGPQLCLPATFEGFRDLQQLQELRLQQGCRITSSSSLRFPPSLTLLQLNSPPEMSANNPTLTQLSNLQHLGIFDGRGFDPVLLRSYPKLQHLQLDSTEIADTAVAELLSALAQLKHLQHLNLWDTLKVDIVEAEPYAALTASSQLTYLDLYESFFAPGAAKFIFAADRPCKGLIEVSTGAELFYAPGSFDRLASCCPALQRLELCHGTDESPEIDLQGLTALQALTDLTKLAFSEVLLDDEALSILASLMQLQDLGLMTAINRQEGVTLAGVMQLTELTALTSLELNRYAAGPHSDVAFVNEAAEGSDPDVFVQLYIYCAAHLQQEEERMEAVDAAPTSM